jgi:hypothetical protein
LAEARQPPVETERQIYSVIAGTAAPVARSPDETIRRKESEVSQETKDQKEQVPPAVISAPPEKELEREVQKNPGDSDAKADLGSDESMDASDPSSATQPGCDDEPVPSSGFPEEKGR